MAEKNQKQIKKEELLTLLLIPPTILGIAKIAQEAEKNNNKTYKNNVPIVGNYILISHKAHIYENLENAINKNNPRIPYYSFEEERQIISAFYQINGNYKRVNINEDYENNENEIINNGGELIAVLTVDPSGKEIEGYYSIEDIFGYDFSKQKTYTKNLGN